VQHRRYVSIKGGDAEVYATDLLMGAEYAYTCGREIHLPEQEYFTLKTIMYVGDVTFVLMNFATELHLEIELSTTQPTIQ